MERFPISICMAGAVSAGAYSAGAMSVLLEALRLLEADNNLPNKPKHRILLKGISGASAGSIQAALSTLDIFSNPNDTGEYIELGKQAWAAITITKLLDNSDLDNDNNVYSILNSNKLQQIAFDQTREHIKAKKAPAFIDKEFQLRFSITNLRGVPYTLSFPQGTSVDFGMSQHNEHLRYSFSENDQDSPKHYSINPLNIGQFDYMNIVTGALASGSFPAAFAITELNRPNLNDENLFTQMAMPMLQDAKQTSHGISATFSMQDTNPDWRYPDENKVLAIDGGATNNEPLIEAFKILYGDDFWNWETTPTNKTGKVIFIDPFPNPVDKNLDKNDTRVDKALGLMMSALIGQARFSPKLIASRAHQDKVGLVYPSLPWQKTKKGIHGQKIEQHAIKSGALGGFSGFLKKEFMDHDYELGKLNMRRFLRYHFTLKKTDKLFADDSDYQNNWDNGSGELPIIPVYAIDTNGNYIQFSADDKDKYYEENLKEYNHKYEFSDRKKLSKALTLRLKALGSKLINVHSKSESGRTKRSRQSGLITKNIMLLGWRFKGAKFLSNSILRTIENSLYEQNLLNYSLFEEDELDDSMD